MNDVQTLPNGTLRVQCPTHLVECREQAEAHCRERGGVRELEQREEDRLYGVDGNKAGTLMSELVFTCGDDAPRQPIRLPARTTASASATPRAATPPKASRRICIPGSTQRCVGPGACVGGQSCAADGSEWGLCDCGPAPAGPASSAAPASSAGSATSATPLTSAAPETSARPARR